MPPTESPAKTVPTGRDDVTILLLEMQPHIVAASRTIAEADFRRATGVVVGLSRALGMPIVASAVPFAGQPPVLIEELSDLEPRTRSVVGALADGPIAATLREGGRRTLVIGGVSSELAVLRSSLQARAEGYDVTVLVDLCGGLSERTEASAFHQMRAAGVTLSNVSSFFTGLAGDMESDDGKAVMGGVAQLWSWGDAH